MSPIRGLHLAGLALAAGCGSMSSSRQHVEFASLVFDVPGDWQHKDKIFKGVSTTICTPEANENKESITVIRTELVPVTARASEAQLGELLEHAESSLGAKVSQATAVLTANGYSGARVDVEYTPPGQRDLYRRIHIVLVDGSSLVHVVYTAKQPDLQLTALTTVLNTLREGEG